VKWDADNRLIQIDYPGTNNNSQFSYDGLGRKVSIVETASGSVTSTKNFTWCQDSFNPYKPCEARNASGVVSAQYFTLGEIVSGTSYFFTADHLANPPDIAAQFLQTHAGTGSVFSPLFTSSIREVTNSAGVIQSQLSYDVYGRVSRLQGSFSPDFQFGDYYFHESSGLSFTLTRPYASSQGRFIGRDRIGEFREGNLYNYMDNHPEIGLDPSGECAVVIVIPIVGGLTAGEAGVLGGMAAIGLGGTAWAAGQIMGGYIMAAGKTMSIRCQKQKQDCISKCSDTALPTHCPQGTPFFICVNNCMTSHGCPRIY
jgi:RHS repeat-associated protein